MRKKIKVILIVSCLFLINISLAVAQQNQQALFKIKSISNKSSDYGIQWQMNFGSDGHYGARYEGPQPIGDCDNDGLNELLVGGRDAKLRVFEWDETKQTYLEMHTLHCPFFPLVSMDSDGFAIGDITGDGENEIAVSWYSTMHKWTGNKYNIDGVSTWIEDNDGASTDCFIGDCDNDGQNEIIHSCREWGGSVPEIVVFGWNGQRLVKESHWDDPGVDAVVFMAGCGDVDEDGENEIVCGSANKVVVLDWNKETEEFESTVIKTTYGDNYPFACICKDSDMDGKNEIHIGYSSPWILILEWDGSGYIEKSQKVWPGEGSLIEGLDVGDCDNDGFNEVVAGTDIVHILQWDGNDYIEEAVLPTWGDLAVVTVGDCDNDGLNEINVGSVIIDYNQDYMEWVFKYGIETNYNYPYDTMAQGSLKVKVERNLLGSPLNYASVAAWDQNNNIWYDIQPEFLVSGSYYRNDIPEGEYLLRALVEGFEPQETTITIIGGQETTYIFSLKPVLLNDISQITQSFSIVKNLIINNQNQIVKSIISTAINQFTE